MMKFYLQLVYKLSAYMPKLWAASRAKSGFKFVSQIGVLLVLISSFFLQTAVAASSAPSVSAGAILRVGVSGIVTDEKGVPLPGVGVKVKGATTSTATDASGRYAINVPDGGTLVFTFIGFTTQETSIGNRTRIDVKLVESATALNEVVVVGYGTQDRSQVSGAVSTIKATSLKDLQVTSVDQKLQGQISGVQVSQTTGFPGGGASVRIRGTGSISAQAGANDPLYVIDGFPISNTFNQQQNPLATINPDDIESITVLKDAASTSIYGSRGSNGVILINTKRAKAGQSTIEVTSTLGYDVLPDNRRLNTMNAQEYAQFRYEAAQDRAASLGLAFDERMVPVQYRNPASLGEGTDWYKAITQRAPTSNLNLSITKGSENVRSVVSMGYYKQEGVIIKTGINRYSLRANVDASIGKKVTIGLNLAPSYTKRFGPLGEGSAFGGAATSIIGAANMATRAAPIYNADGTYTQNIPTFDNNFTTYTSANPTYTTGAILQINPVNVANNIRQDTYNFRTLANTYLSWKVLSGLTAKTTFNVDFGNDRTDNFFPSYLDARYTTGSTAFSTGLNSRRNTLNWLNENTLDYTKKWGDHSFSALAGFTVQDEKTNLLSNSGSLYNNDVVYSINNATVVTGAATIEEWRLLSLLSRLNYSFKDKYILSATVRRDGSSRFGNKNRYGTFPSASAAWVLSNESFFPKDGVIDEVKLRGSYGLSGNNSIGNFSFLPGVNATTLFYDFNGASASAAALTSLPNNDLTWEKSKQTDLGLDISLLKGRINFISEAYRRITSGMLQNINIPYSAGFASGVTNLGKIRNQGLEFTLNTKNFVNDFKWGTDFNISMNRNMVLSLGKATNFTSGANLIAVGYPIGMFYTHIANGFFTAQELAITNQNDPNYIPRFAGQVTPGSIKVLNLGTSSDVPGIHNSVDKVLDAGDRVVTGSPYPKFTFGMTNRFNYKNVDMSVLVQGSEGNHVYTQYKYWTNNLDGSFNVEKEVANRWRSESNPGAGILPTTNGNTNTIRDGGANAALLDSYVKDASFIAVRNITLGYNFKLKTSFSNSFRAYFSTQNPFIFTKYKGSNPEVNTSGNTPLNPGIDTQGYPIGITYSAGLNMRF